MSSLLTRRSTRRRSGIRSFTIAVLTVGEIVELGHEQTPSVSPRHGRP
jgi:hypothetical protein